MKRIHIYLEVISLCILIMAFNNVERLPKSIQKKVDKELQLNWPENEISIHSIELGEELKTDSRHIGLEDVYLLKSGSLTLGYMAYAKVPSKFDVFDIAIFYDTLIEIRSMKVLAYREDHGGEVGSKRWLKQFIGKTANDPITLNEDIQGISGATLSCVSATKGAKEITVFISRLDLR